MLSELAMCEPTRMRLIGRWGLCAVALLFVLGSPVKVGAEDCSKDTDCKGARICGPNGRCENPTDDEARLACGLVEPVAPDIVLGLASTDAERVLREIGRAALLSNMPDIMSGPVDNAAAMIRGGRRLIVYNPQFLRDLTKRGGTDWAVTFVVGHELGHHAEGHTVSSGCDHKFELQADGFSARALKRMGASLEEATAAMRAMKTGESECHPSSSERVARIESEYEEEDEDEEEEPEPTPRRKKKTRRPPPPEEEEDPEPPVSRPRGYPQGYGTLRCGCHGPAMPGQQRPNPSCASGFEVALPCQGFCPPGGSPWGMVCG